MSDLPRPEPFPRAKGQQFTLEMSAVPGGPNPPFGPGCQFHVFIDGTEVQPGQSVGNFKCIGLGGGGTATFENLTDNAPSAKFEFELRCENCGPTREGVYLPPPIINKQPNKGCMGMLIGPAFAIIAARSGS